MKNYFKNRVGGADTHSFSSVLPLTVNNIIIDGQLMLVKEDINSLEQYYINQYFVLYSNPYSSVIDLITIKNICDAIEISPDILGEIHELAEEVRKRKLNK